MSIFKVSAKLDMQSVEHVVVVANERDTYLESWLRLLGTASYVTETMQRFHWNVRGSNSFLPIHKDLLQPLYELAFDLQDKFGEKYRALDINSDIPSEVFTKYNTIEQSYSEYAKESNYTKKTNRYLGYTVRVLMTLRSLMLDVNKQATEQGDLGGQNLLSGQVETLDAWIWKVKSSLPKKK